MKEKGITLIALVITIIVLLILATVTIATLTGENGIISKAREAKEKTEIAEVIEKAKMDLLASQVENDGALTNTDLKITFEKYFDGVPETLPDDLSTLTLKTKAEYVSHDITLSDIWNGTTASTNVKTYTVTYDVNGGNGGPSSQTKIEGRDLTLSSKQPTRSGFVFFGWGKDNNSLAYQPGDTYNEDASITLYAIWGIEFSPSTGGGTNDVSDSTHHQYTTDLFSADIPSGVTVKLEYNMTKSTASSLSLKYTIDYDEKVTAVSTNNSSNTFNDTYTWKNDSGTSVRFSFMIEGAGANTNGWASGSVYVVELQDDQGRPLAFRSSEV